MQPNGRTPVVIDDQDSRTNSFGPQRWMLSAPRRECRFWLFSLGSAASGGSDTSLAGPRRDEPYVKSDGMGYASGTSGGRVERTAVFVVRAAVFEELKPGERPFSHKPQHFRRLLRPGPCVRLETRVTRLSLGDRKPGQTGRRRASEAR